MCREVVQCLFCQYLLCCVHVDQQVRTRIPSGIDSSFFNLAHDDSEIRVDGQLLGYSIDAVDDFAIVSSLHVMLTR